MNLMQCNAVLFNIKSCNVYILCYAVLFCFVLLCCAVLNCVGLCCVDFFCHVLWLCYCCAMLGDKMWWIRIHSFWICRVEWKPRKMSIEPARVLILKYSQYPLYLFIQKDLQLRRHLKWERWLFEISRPLLTKRLSYHKETHFFFLVRGFNATAFEFIKYLFTDFRQENNCHL